MKTFLIIGCCGTGKTHIMKELIRICGVNNESQYGLYHFRHGADIAVLGKYTGDIFDGSDRLSMSIMKDNSKVLEVLKDFKVIAEGDRFTNSSFIRDFSPIILKILGDGKTGRELRGSNQTERHLKSIATRVSNIEANYEFKDNTECLAFLINEIKGVNQNKETFIPQKTTLF